MLQRDGGLHLQPASHPPVLVTDRSSGLRFLVDTGAEVSVLPVSWLSRSTSPAGPTFQAVNHSTIATFGSTSRTINLGLRQTFSCVFLVADVKHPILGADFLHYFNLLVDVSKGRLIDTIPTSRSCLTQPKFASSCG